MKSLRYISIFAGMLCCMLFTSCDVHEFPDPDKELPFVLHLNYDTNLPLYKVVEYHEDTRSEVDANYDIRYIVKIFPAGDSREELFHYEFFKDDISELNNDVTIMLKEGKYRFVVWTDYVSAGEASDLFYDTHQFEEIVLKGDEHYGCNDLRDAFNGTVETEVSKKSSETTIEMSRPLAKFAFISDDLKDFMAHLIKARAESDEQSRADNDVIDDGSLEDAKNIDLSDLRVVFRYYGFMPSSFNMFTNKPASAVTGISFDSQIRVLNDNEADLGFDYVFVNGAESAVNVSIEVFDENGEMLSRFKPIKVPLIRSKLTVVKANFLTSKANGGVSIVPDFDGEYNFPVY